MIKSKVAPIQLTNNQLDEQGTIVISVFDKSGRQIGFVQADIKMGELVGLTLRDVIGLTLHHLTEHNLGYQQLATRKLEI